MAAAGNPRRKEAALALAAWLAAAGGIAQEKTFSEVLDVDLVNVDVVVLDQNGNLVTDLAREDFQITDDGKKVKIDYFARLGAAGSATLGDRPSAEPADDRSGAGPVDPLHLVIFVDLDNLAPHSRSRVLGELESGLAAFTGRARVMVATFGPRGLDIELPFSESPAEWAAAFTAVEDRPGRGAQRQAEQRRLVESIEQVLALAETGGAQAGGGVSRNPLEAARNRFDELVGNVRVQSESIRADAMSTLRAVQTLASVLSVVAGQKSLLYVGDGVPIHPGRDLNELLADVFERDRRFAQSGGDASSTSSGSPSPSDEVASTPASGRPPAPLPDLSSSPATLRLDAMSLALTPELRALTATANSQRVTLYGLSTDAPGGTVRADFKGGARTSGGVMQTYDVMRSQLLEQSLQLMAGDTGGLALPPKAGAADFLDRVLADQENRYSLAYTSPHGGDSRYHDIKVKVNRKGVRLRHREGYFDRPREVRIGDLVAGALLLGSAENPHRMKMEVVSQEPAANGEVKASLGLRIPVDELRLVLAGDTHQTQLDFYVLSREDGGSFAPMRHVAVTVSIPSARMADAAGRYYGATVPLSLREGRHAVAVGVVEPAAQRTSVATMSVDVGDDG